MREFINIESNMTSASFGNGVLAAISIMLLIATGPAMSQQEQAPLKVESVDTVDHRYAAAKLGDPVLKREFFEFFLANSEDLSNYREPALRLLIEAGDAGDPMAMHLIGALLVNGILVNKDVTKGLGWLLKSRAEGVELSSLSLGLAYLELYHTSNSESDRSVYNTEAIGFLREAASAGLEPAIGFLGQQLILDPETFDEGLEYLERAAEQGDELSAEYLYEIEQYMKGTNRIGK